MQSHSDQIDSPMAVIPLRGPGRDRRRTGLPACARILITGILLVGAALAQSLPGEIGFRATRDTLYLENTGIRLQIDKRLRMRVQYPDGDALHTLVVDDSLPTDYLRVDGQALSAADRDGHRIETLTGAFGDGVRLTTWGDIPLDTDRGPVTLRQTLTVDLYPEHPGVAITTCRYAHRSGEMPVAVEALVSGAYTLDRRRVNPAARPFDFTLFQGRGVDWGLDYCAIPIDSAYAADNFMGVTEAHRDPPGGGIPLLDVWGPEMGMAIAHLSDTPEFAHLPIAVGADGRVRLRLESRYDDRYEPLVLLPGAEIETLPTMVLVHALDYFEALHGYARLLNAAGIRTFKDSPGILPAAYWKTWGYQLDFAVADIYAKLPEFKTLGIELVVLDDGWFSNYGDWEPSTAPGKFPRGRPDLIAFVDSLHRAGFKVGAWWSPQIAEPHSRVAQEHPEWRMLQADGSPYVMKGPDAYYLCPDLEPVLAHWEGQIEKLFRTFDLDYIYHDWANLIGVPPCYDPRHGHESPLSAPRRFPEQFERMYDKIQAIKPGSPVEMCECGRPHDPYKMPYYSITNASDATSERQVREKLKVEKALNGAGAVYAPGYVLAEPGFGYDPCPIDAAVAMGGYFCTYYTELTPAQRENWTKWLDIYHREKIYTGRYLNHYDIVYDTPEVHLTRTDAAYFYYSPGPVEGPMELRGLEARAYRVSDLASDSLVGWVQGPTATIEVNAGGAVALKVVAVDR